MIARNVPARVRDGLVAAPGTGAFRRATTFVDFIRGGHLLADRIPRALTP